MFRPSLLPNHLRHAACLALAAAALTTCRESKTAVASAEVVAKPPGEEAPVQP